MIKLHRELNGLPTRRRGTSNILTQPSLDKGKRANASRFKAKRSTSSSHEQPDSKRRRSSDGEYEQAHTSVQRIKQEPLPLGTCRNLDLLPKALRTTHAICLEGLPCVMPVILTMGATNPTSRLASPFLKPAWCTPLTSVLPTLHADSSSTGSKRRGQECHQRGSPPHLGSPPQPSATDAGADSHEPPDDHPSSPRAMSMELIDHQQQQQEQELPPPAAAALAAAAAIKQRLRISSDDRTEGEPMS